MIVYIRSGHHNSLPNIVSYYNILFLFLTTILSSSFIIKHLRIARTILYNISILLNKYVYFEGFI